MQRLTYAKRPAGIATPPAIRKEGGIMATVHLSETHDAALVRLAHKARAEGIRLYRDRNDGRHYASSASTPGRLHYVTGLSCDCVGFATHQRCQHFAALLAGLGWLATDPEPAPAMVVSVAYAGGYYTLPGLNDRGGEWCEPVSTILVDGRETIRITGDTSALSVWWLENGRPIDDMTGATPSCLDHYLTVDYWIRSLDDRVPAHVPMQAAGLFPVGEFIDAIVAA